MIQQIETIIYLILGVLFIGIFLPTIMWAVGLTLGTESGGVEMLLTILVPVVIIGYVIWYCINGRFQNAPQ